MFRVRAWLRREWLAVACLVVLVSLLALSRSPHFVEHAYARALSPTLCRLLAAATGWLPFSVADLCLAGGTLAFVGLLGRGVWRVAHRRCRPWPALRTGLARVLRAALAVGTVFYATWGLNYYRRPLPERLGWPPQGQLVDRAAQIEELDALCAAAVRAANAAYRAAFAADDLGAVSTWPNTASVLEQAVDVGLDAAGRELGLDTSFLGSRGPSKRSLLSPLMSRLHLSGFFFPWTGEANVNDEPTACDVVHVVAHEKSHQRGIAREDEAEFLGFLAGARAPHSYLRYAAYVYAQQILLRELTHVDMSRIQAHRAARLPGVQRDLTAAIAFWNKNRGKLVKIARTVNDTYLKSHGIEKGVLSYGAAADLLVRYARVHGGLDGPAAAANK